MHFVMPLMYPNRCDNEAFISERIDLTNINAYLEKKNADNPEYAYNLFQVMVTAVLKTITLRPKMNRFIANKTMYLRNEVSAAFTVKKVFSDNGAEALAQVHTTGTETIDDIHAGYHHLTNWGTCSVFCAIGEAKKRPFFDDDGAVHMKDSVDIGLTIDERIADGYYYSRTVQLLKKLLENPELLDRPLNEEIDY